MVGEDGTPLFDKIYQDTRQAKNTKSRWGTWRLWSGDKMGRSDKEHDDFDKAADTLCVSTWYTIEERRRKTRTEIAVQA